MCTIMGRLSVKHGSDEIWIIDFDPKAWKLQTERKLARIFKFNDARVETRSARRTRWSEHNAGSVVERGLFMIQTLQLWWRVVSRDPYSIRFEGKAVMQGPICSIHAMVLQSHARTSGAFQVPCALAS